MTRGFQSVETPDPLPTTERWDHSPPKVCFEEYSSWLVAILHVMNIQTSKGWSSMGGVVTVSVDSICRDGMDMQFMDYLSFQVVFTSGQVTSVCVK